MSAPDPRLVSMSAAAKTPQARFTHLAEEFLGEPGVTHAFDGDGQRRRGFGSNALMVDGKIFAMLVRDRLVVKIPLTRVDALVEDGDGERFDPRKNGRVMKEWLVLAEDSGVDWSRLAAEARVFVAPTG